MLNKQIESRYFVSETMTFNKSDGEYLPKWKLEERYQSWGREYYIHYFTPKSNEYTVLPVRFSCHYGNAHLSYLADNAPERIQELLNNDNIYLYLLRMNRKTSDAVEQQVEKWKKTESDFLLARKNNDFLTEAGLIENMNARAEELILPTIVYA